MTSRTKMPRASTNKQSVIKAAKKYGRTQIWLDTDGKWRAAIDASNVPNFAVKVEEVR